MSTYEISASAAFSAAHTLTGVIGACAGLHGHDFRVTATLRCGKLDEHAVSVDFALLCGWLRDVVKPWDHAHLNSLPAFEGLNPTAETIARLVHEGISEALSASSAAGRATVDSVTVREGEGLSMTYRPPRRIEITLGADSLPEALTRAMVSPPGKA